MESLVNYESDDESGDCNDIGKCNSQSQQRTEEDANYDEIGMDESSECHDPNFLDLRQSEGHLVQESSAQNRNITTKRLSFGEYPFVHIEMKNIGQILKKESNNNHAEGHFSAMARERGGGGGGGGGGKMENCKDSPGNESAQEKLSFRSERNSISKSEDESSQNGLSQDGFKEQSHWNNAGNAKSKSDRISGKSDETSRRHSSDMEMDDGEDDLDNYKVGGETTLDFRQKFAPKGINFTKGRNLGEETECHRPPNVGDGRSSGSWEGRSAESEKNASSDESHAMREEKGNREKGKEERRKEEYFRRDEKERRREEEKWRESDRERRREGDKYKDERDRKRSPDRREHKKRSHSPDRRERDREYDRDRSRDRERSRERIRERDRDRDRDREKEKDRDRDRDYRAGDRRSPKHPKRSSGSPERSWKSRKLEKKAAVLNKLGIELKADVSGNLTPRQLLGEQLKAQIQEVEAKTGVTLPTYYNPGVMNPLKYAQQIQKRKLLWGNKSNESKANESSNQGSAVPSTVKQWEAATFKGDNDGKMTEKFKRLMGIKGDTSTGNVASSSSKPPETKEIIQKQEEMFSNMEAQYQVARMATHTHRGVGLGFGTFQVPPR